MDPHKPSSTDEPRDVLHDDETGFPARDAGTSASGQRDAPAAHDAEEAGLDEALEETFPASDPIPPDAGKALHPQPPQDKREDMLDEALDDTFPASDPVALNAPHRKRQT